MRPMEGHQSVNDIMKLPGSQTGGTDQMLHVYQRVQAACHSSQPSQGSRCVTAAVASKLLRSKHSL